MAAPAPIAPPGIPPEFVFTRDQVKHLERLDGGAYGEVWRGEFVGKPGQICIKVNHMLQNPGLYGLVPGTPEYKRALEEVRREANMLYALSRRNCPHVLAFRGVVFAAGTADPEYILFEFAIMGSLRRLLDSLARRYTVRECVRLADHVLAGLREMHELQPDSMIHRDLKPENILVFHGPTGEVEFKVGDLGQARLLPAAGLPLTATPGTARYQAPEILHGRAYGVKSDVFSIGVVLAEVVTRYVMPEGQVPLYVDQRQLGNMVASATQYLRSIGEDGFAQLLEKCVADDPDARPSSRDALAAVRMLGPLAPPPPAANRGAVGAGAAGVPVVPGARDNVPQVLEPPVKPTSAWSSATTVLAAGAVAVVALVLFGKYGPLPGIQVVPRKL